VGLPVLPVLPILWLLHFCVENGNCPFSRTGRRWIEQLNPQVSAAKVTRVPIADAVTPRMTR
jgi:hypothetical protein